MHPNIHSSTVYNSQDMEATKMSINRWMDKEDVVHMYNGILLSHDKEWNNAICNMWMYLEIIILCEVRQRKTNTVWYHFYVESKIWHKWIYFQARNRLPDIETRLVIAKGVEGRMECEFGISRCKVLHIGWINNKVLLYSTGKYIQYPVINDNGKESEIYIYIYIYIYESPETNTTL